jgi:predicted nucleotidyltransferase component of viral defense system
VSVDVNRALLVELAEEIGVDPVYLEKDFVLTEIVHAYATGPHREQLVLKGGQALRHIYGSRRLSRDVDYVARRRMEFDDLRDGLAIRYPRLTVPAQPAGRTARGITIDPIEYRGPLGNRDNVELEVSFREDLVLDPQWQIYPSPFREPFPVLVMQIDEMVAEKIRALYQRGNPRDLYDLWFVFTAPAIAIDHGAVADLIPRKIRPPFVAHGWDRSKLYDRLLANRDAWEPLIAIAPDRPAFDDTFDTVERALRFLPK